MKKGSNEEQSNNANVLFYEVVQGAAVRNLKHKPINK
jgi:hypothetical protein